MKLLCSSTSPFARKVLLVAHEVGLENQVERVSVNLSPTAPDETLNRLNPLGKIPALIADDGEVFFDSRVMVEMLDDAHHGRRMIPVAGVDRYRVKRIEALADGILDAGILIRYELVLRPSEARWDRWIQSQAQKVERGLTVLENELPSFPDAVDLRHIATAAMLAWLDFRRPSKDFLAPHPALRTFLTAFSARPSMIATKLIATKPE